MAITTTAYKRCQVVAMDGRIDSATGDDLHKSLMALVDSGQYKIVFDMTNVEFMSSKGWWVLIETQKACRRYNRGELVLANVPARILSSLDLVGMSNYFKIFEDTVAAVGHF
ncbi:MAG: STAS domain-containing protein [Chloroflexi bacterium]|nr:STAS domain-containing protein [Chloroflexota bacterium]